LSEGARSYCNYLVHIACVSFIAKGMWFSGKQILICGLKINQATYQCFYVKFLVFVLLRFFFFDKYSELWCRTQHHITSMAHDVY